MHCHASQWPIWLLEFALSNSLTLFFGLSVSSSHDVLNVFSCINIGICMLNGVLDDSRKNHISALGIGTLHFAGRCFWCHAHGVPSCTSC